jgi:hypothetical protein
MGVDCVWNIEKIVLSCLDIPWVGATLFFINDFSSASCTGKMQYVQRNTKSFPATTKMSPRYAKSSISYRYYIAFCYEAKLWRYYYLARQQWSSLEDGEDWRHSAIVKADKSSPCGRPKDCVRAKSSRGIRQDELTHLSIQAFDMVSVFDIRYSDYLETKNKSEFRY